MRLLVFVLLALLVIACDNQRVFENYVEFPARKWPAKEPATFEFEIKNAAQEYNLYYEVRNSIDYPWERIFVRYELKDSTAVLSEKLVFNTLFEKSGKPLGRSGLGDVYDHQFEVLTHYRFPQAGTYRFTLHHENRQDSLAGILAIGLRVELATAK